MRLLLAVLLPVLVAVAYQYLFLSGDAPPADYGSGSMFDTIAPRYDLVNRVLSLNMDMSWRRKLVAAIQTPSARKYLDVATGTGDVAILLAKLGVPVVGVDPSAHMLQVAAQKIPSNVELVQLNDYDFAEPQSFDGATMSFGIRNVPDKRYTLCGIHRLLAPRAKFGILEFSEPEPTNILSTLAGYFIRYVVPFVGGILSGKPREYWHLQNSIQDFPAPKQFGEYLEGLDCPTGTFRLQELWHLNFGSVQLYVLQVVAAQV